MLSDRSNALLETYYYIRFVLVNTRAVNKKYLVNFIFLILGLNYNTHNI